MFCRNCGKELTGTPEFCTNCGTKPMAGTSFCPGCGAPTTSLTEICTNCGARVAEAVKKRTWKPKVGGILAIIAGVFQVLIGTVFAIIFVEAVLGLLGFALWGLGWSLLVLLIGIVAIVGGIYALRRRIWGLALAGSICALVGPWFILGILAIIFVILGKREFR